MSDENKVLNLDELFGAARAVKVRWKETEYELLRMEGIGPREATQFNRLYLQSANVQQSLKGDVDEGQAIEIDNILTKMLKILCKDLPVDEMPFIAKMKTIQFYMEQTQGKKVMEADLKRLTGEMSSRA